MKAIALALLASAAALAAGCQNAGTGASPFMFGDAKGGLGVDVSLPHRAYTRGDAVPVTVTARNTSDKPITFSSDSQAKVTVTLSRNIEAGWEEVKRYPSSLVKVPVTWTLEPGGSQSFEVNLTAGPDWPSAEDLRLAAWVNGQPDVKPNGIIRVYASRRDCDKARTYFGPQP